MTTVGSKSIERVSIVLVTIEMEFKSALSTIGTVVTELAVSPVIVCSLEQCMRRQTKTNITVVVVVAVFRVIVYVARRSIGHDPPIGFVTF
jgi:hypothetical protein